MTDSTLLEEFFHALTDFRNEPHFLIRRDGELLAASRAAGRLVGADPPGPVGANITELVTESRQQVLDYLKLCAGTATPIPGVLTFRDRRGGSHRCRCQGFRLVLPSLPDSDGCILLQTMPNESISSRFISLNRTLEELRRSRHKLEQRTKQLEQEIAERLRAEEALRQSHDRLTTILDSLEAVVYVADMQTYEILFLNRYARDVMGDITGMICWQSIQQGQDGPCPFCTNKYLVDSSGKATGTYAWDFQNTKNSRWYRIQDQAIPWVDGRLVRIEIAIDITAQKEAELQQREANRLLENVFSSTIFLIAYMDAEFNFIRVNRRYAEADKREPDFFVGKNHFDLYPDEENQKIFRQVVESGVPHVEQARPFTSRQGEGQETTTYWDWGLYPVRGENGRVEAVILFLVDVTDRVVALESLRQSEKMLQNIMDSVPPHIYIKDRKNRFVLVNESFARAMGVSREELIGRSAFDHCLSETARKSWRDDRRVMESGKVLTNILEQRKRNRNGDIGWFSTDKVPYRDADGRVVGVIAVSTDITEQKRAEDALKLNEERLQALWRLSQLDTTSEAQLIDQALDAAIRLTGSIVGFFHFYDEEKKTITFACWRNATPDCCCPDEGTACSLDQAGDWAECVRRRHPVILNDYQGTDANGHFCRHHLGAARHYMSVPVFDRGKIVAIVGVGARDRSYDRLDVHQLALYASSAWGILRQKRMELEIRKAKEEWEATFDAIEEVITLQDTEMTVIRANRAAGELFGINPAALTGRKCHELFRGKDVPCEGCPEKEAVAECRTRSAVISHPLLQKTFEVSVSPVTDSRGELKVLVHIAKDITGRLALEHRLRQAQKMEAMGTLAGGIAHDFNNILSPILGYSELALNKLSSTSPVTHDIEQVLQAATRARELVKQILTFSRRSEQELKPLQLHAIVKESVKLLRSSLPSTIEIRQQIATDCGTVLADPTQIHQIVINLCTNAYHAMRDRGGVLGIRLSALTVAEADDKVLTQELEAGPYVLLEVSDSGHGMDRRTMEKIFEPYFTTKPKGEGTGLGLSIVHGIVKAHGGHITVYSEPGQGTTFHVYFPTIEKRDFFGEAVLKQPLPRGQGRILAVDDEETIVELIGQLLADLGYTVTSFTSSEKALEAFLREPDHFDVVITDMTMPKLTGLQLATRILEARPDMPIILCTGYSELVDEKIARAAGIRKYLMKPVSRKKLAYAVREALSP